MNPVFIYLFLSVLIDPSSSSLYTRTGYKQFIKDLNLHPTLDANIFKQNTSDYRIVEKPLRLPVLGQSGASTPNIVHATGYVRIKHTIGGRMFYYFFQSRHREDDPVVIWLTGGPGCSSAIALFEENGPFLLNKNLSLVWNKYGWDKVANMIYIDQPIGTGFSYTSSEKDIRHHEKGVSNDLYDFLQGFFTKHPDYVKNELYITGESYGGHYVPALASRINHRNKNKQGIHLNLKGLAIGNGMTVSGIQFGQADTDFALMNNLINETDYKRLNQIVQKCEKAAKKCGTDGEESCLKAVEICQQIYQDIISISHICEYDIRRRNCYNITENVDKYLNKPSVKKALGVPQDIMFASCSDVVKHALLADIMRHLEGGLPELLEEGIKMLIFAGDCDFACNWIGNYRWVRDMKWSGQSNFKASNFIPFQVDGKEAGELKNYDNLSFLKVHEAGHMVPMDQPKASLKMLKRWMDGKLSVPEAEDSRSLTD
ncbi:serine carboxypeptidase-like [Rutidosis leptorrhynchoides]|uniref:serine carboxypeptidase-like n=1 Tax=Rutidosis leptorrhynchoides TaxID=125765 RepID=UPI003A995E11